MLVLVRRSGEKLVLTLPDGTQAEITILEISGQRVRVGIEADPKVKVMRPEAFSLAKKPGKK